jgi:DNA-binding transcriptional MerR regulator
MTTDTLVWLSISDAAELAGTTPSVLRVWEQRYGWPAPRRSPSGYRRFTPADASLIRQVVARVDAGTPISEIIHDGRPHLLPPAARPQPISLDLSDLPRPTTADGQAAQRALLLGIAQRHPGQIRAAVALCARLHPRERGPAVLLVLDAVRRQHPDHAWLDRILES